MTDFIGQKAIVTGATRGIGRAITLALVKRGVEVVGIYGGDEEAASRLRDDCADLDGHIYLHCLDVSDYQAVQRFYAGVEEEFGTIDILVNNAGIRRDGVVAMMKEEDWRRVIDVNLSGGF
ncbi:MAG: SDR family NAD(P)-dependent oxidoreductase, partial [Desulfobulbaceae bacterium]|nr:SDR family NAD(P)-dependent oxidoreductase [Desulfobulbaceae bacterium]